MRHWFGSPFWRSLAIWWVVAFAATLLASLAVGAYGLLFGW